MSISPDVFRTGKKYRLLNFGDTYEFIIEKFVGKNDYLLKDIHTLENYYFLDLIKYGKSGDYLLEEYESDHDQ